MTSTADPLAEDSAETPLKAPARDVPKGPSRLLFPKYQSVWQSILYENKILRVTAFGTLMLSVLCLGVLMTQGDRTRTIVVPFATGSQNLWITGDKPSDDYLRAIARNAVSLLGTFTGSSAEQQFEELLAHVHPSEYEDLRVRWRQLAEEMRSFRDVSFATYIRPDRPITVKTDRLEVPATRIRFIGRTKTEDRGAVHIGYVIENGRFWMTSYDFVEEGSSNVSTAK